MCENHANGGVLIVRAREEQLAQAGGAALDTACQAREKILATLAASNTAKCLINIIPSLGPFIEIADKFATVGSMISGSLLMF